MSSAEKEKQENKHRTEKNVKKEERSLRNRQVDVRITNALCDERKTRDLAGKKGDT